MTDFITNDSLKEFTDLLSTFNIVLKEVNFNQESFDVQLHGQVQKVRMPGQSEVEMTMIATPHAVNALMDLTKELANLERLKLNTHPAVIDQYQKLLQVAALAEVKGDDNACDSA